MSASEANTPPSPLAATTFADLYGCAHDNAFMNCEHRLPTYFREAFEGAPPHSTDKDFVPKLFAQKLHDLGVWDFVTSHGKFGYFNEESDGLLFVHQSFFVEPPNEPQSSCAATRGWIAIYLTPDNVVASLGRASGVTEILDTLRKNDRHWYGTKCTAEIRVWMEEWGEGGQPVPPTSGVTRIDAYSFDEGANEWPGEAQCRASAKKACDIAQARAERAYKTEAESPYTTKNRFLRACARGMYDAVDCADFYETFRKFGRFQTNFEVVGSADLRCRNGGAWGPVLDYRRRQNPEFKAIWVDPRPERERHRWWSS